MTKKENNGMGGSFMKSLMRNNKEIRKDRAQSIADDTEMVLRREIEDLSILIKRKKRERENMLDLSPASADSLVLAASFDAKVFVAYDLKLGVDIRNDTIKLEIAEERYADLFGDCDK